MPKTVQYVGEWIPWRCCPSCFRPSPELPQRTAALFASPEQHQPLELEMSEFRAKRTSTMQNAYV